MSVHDLRRAIEPLKAKAQARARAGTALRERTGPNPELMARLDGAEHSALVIECALVALADELPGLWPSRHLAQGGWVVCVDGLEQVRPFGGRPRKAYSRLEVLVSIREDGHALELACHRTVLDRDLEALRTTLPLPAPSDAELSEWVEAACLEFAEALLARRAAVGRA